MNHELEESERRTSESIGMAKAIVLPLMRSRRHYLDDQDLERYGITRTYIDFASGKIGDGSEQFIEPIDPDLVEDWVRMAKVDCGDLEPRGPDGTFFNDDQLEAAFFNVMILRYLSESYDKAGYGPSILNTHTLWKSEP